MNALTRDALLNAPPKSTTVELPDIGGSVRIRQMTAGEWMQFISRPFEERETTGAWLVSICAIDDEGKQLFSADDVSKIQAMSFRTVEAIASAILEMNRLTKQSQEDIAKKS